MLGLRSREDFDARFGGSAYLFLRGMPAAGVHLARPSWDDVVRWERELVQNDSWGVSAA